MSTFKVLFTRQKVQKTKRWAEGFLVEGEHGSVKLFDEDMKIIDNDFKRGSKVKLGDEIDFPSYLVTVDDTFEIKPSKLSENDFVPPKVCTVPKNKSDHNMVFNQPACSENNLKVLSENRFSVGQKRLRTVVQTAADKDLQFLDKMTSAESTPLRCDPLARRGSPTCTDLRQDTLFQQQQNSSFPVLPFERKRTAFEIMELIDPLPCKALRLKMSEDRHEKAQQEKNYDSSSNVSCDLNWDQEVEKSCNVCEVSRISQLKGCQSILNMSEIAKDHKGSDVTSFSSTDWVPVSKKRPPLIRSGLQRQLSTKEQEESSNVDSSSIFKVGKQSAPNYVGFKKTGILYFPSAAETQQTLTERETLIPVTFASWHEYAKRFEAAIYEEINLRVREVAIAFYQACQATLGGKGSGVVLCECQRPALLLTVKKEGPNKGRRFAGCAKKSCKFFKWITDESEGKNFSPNSVFDHSVQPNSEILRQRQVYLFEVTQSGELMQQQKWQSKKFNQFSEDGGGASMKKGKYFFKFRCEEKVSGCSREDLWIISDNPWFGDQPSKILFAKSSWFGPSKDNVIELDFLFGEVRLQAPAFALKGPNISSENDLLQTLSSIIPMNLPLLPILLNPSRALSSSKTCPLKRGQDHIFKIECSDEICSASTKEVVSQFGLNEEQSTVLTKLLDLLRFPEDPANCPVILVHGVFGSGKSTLLVALIVLLLKLAENENVVTSSPLRVLVSAQTNVAVDNILQGLLERHVEDFVRIGCLRRISKSMLKYTVRESGTSEEKIDQESLRDLSERLKCTRDIEEIRCIRAAIMECREGKMKERKMAMNEKRVVGVTCASTRQDILSSLQFPILILDESSQVIEPVSFLPIARFQCKIMIACGDPKQLPPTLTSPSMADTIEEPRDLSRTLFSRLSLAGIEPILLKRQYRCHPAIGSLASSLFYESKLINGVSHEERNQMIKGFAPIVFFDVASGVESVNEHGSFINNEEARLVHFLVRGALQAGIQASEIGVICLYKAQVHSLTEMLTQASGSDENAGGASPLVSTVDAFQGGEREIIIVSCCRTESLGFISSPNRMNVALTRSRRHLILVGNGKTLPKNQFWNQIIDQARSFPGGYFNSREFMMSGFEFELVTSASTQINVNEEDVNESCLLYAKDMISSSPDAKVIEADGSDHSVLERPTRETQSHDSDENITCTLDKFIPKAESAILMSFDLCDSDH